MICTTVKESPLLLKRLQDLGRIEEKLSRLLDLPLMEDANLTYANFCDKYSKSLDDAYMDSSRLREELIDLWAIASNNE